ncbi:hypothetical protein H6G81_15930 [Scytonema hofmannii FACHB-248]|uniref:Uncharacterized protein n=1 Tax=Scytonema hofmannii FACHB-248 TaxID=1842502 RepID=A0ABR8GR87_9CYAN|nr:MULTISPECIES: hypothetical protein [Nostocales]MBD2605970.1 hypothetical protein [Scytonema hofmannii FACHB-248]
MNQHNSNNDDDVIIPMIDHIEKFIEKPNSVFDNMPICPFVNKFRQENKILYKVYNFYYSEKLGLDAKVIDLINEFKKDEYHEVMIVIHSDKQALSLEEMKQFTTNLNNLISPLDLIAFSGHPLDDFNIDGVYTRQDPFINFTVQNIQAINMYAQKLKSTGYYERWTLENLNYINHVI